MSTLVLGVLVICFEFSVLYILHLFFSVLVLHKVNSFQFPQMMKMSFHLLVIQVVTKNKKGKSLSVTQ